MVPCEERSPVVSARRGFMGIRTAVDRCDAWAPEVTPTADKSLPYQTVVVAWLNPAWCADQLRAAQLVATAAGNDGHISSARRH